MEVLVTLVLFSIISGVAAVSLGPLWQKHQLKQATAQLLSQIQTCRMKAIVKQKTYQIKITKQTLSSRYKSGIDWSNWEDYLFPGSALYSMSGTSYFYSKGFASPKTITVTHDNYHQKVIININGRARTSEIY